MAQPPRSVPSLAAKLRATVCIVGGAAALYAIATLLHNTFNDRSILLCARSPGAAADCRVVTGATWEEPRVQPLPNGQLLRARTEAGNVLSRLYRETPVILVTTQGEIYFSDQNTPQSGVFYNFDERINTFLRSPQASSLEIVAPPSSTFTLIWTLVFFSSFPLGFLVLWLLRDTWSAVPLPQKFSATESQWDQSSERLKHLLEPPAKELGDRQE